jgi:hypothetical protein
MNCVHDSPNTPSPQLISVKRRVSERLPASSLLAGDFSQAAVALWGAGIQLDLAHADNTDFRSHVPTVRVLVAMDANVLAPAAIIKSTTVS